ncbi:energy transducer TonB, partial [Novosphingobium piscinae]
MASRAPTLRREEAAGLAVALAAHAALVAWLAFKPPTPAPLPAPERMTVTFADEVAAQSAA